MFSIVYLQLILNIIVCVISLGMLNVTISIKDVRSTEATVNYSYNAQLSNLSLFVMYGEELLIDVRHRKNLTLLSGTVTLGDLKPFTSYTLQLAVMSDDGASLNSNATLTFKTLPAGTFH